MAQTDEVCNFPIRKAAMSAKFNKLTAPDAPVYQKGSITYKFKLQ
jgi:hypothetical protein